MAVLSDYLLSYAAAEECERPRCALKALVDIPKRAPAERFAKSFCRDFRRNNEAAVLHVPRVRYSIRFGTIRIDENPPAFPRIHSTRSPAFCCEPTAQAALRFECATHQDRPALEGNRLHRLRK